MATHKANTPPPNPNSLAIQIRKIIDEERIAITNDVLVVANADRVGLGPAFQLGFSPRLAPMYPLAEEALSFESPCLDWNRFSSDIPNRLWHRPDSKYVEWLDRMVDAKGDLWKQIGIKDAILLSRSLIDMDKHLFLAASQFWSVTTNSFHFKVGLMGPTLQDLAFLTGLRPHGIEANYFLSQKTPYFEYKEPLSFAPFLNHYAQKGPVEDSEHVAFLLYWLNKFIFCVSANRVTKDFIDLACALSSGQKLALGPLVLAHLYRGMKELISNKFIFAPGPLWIMTLWLWSYFPRLAPPMNKKSEHTCYGLHYTDARGPRYAFGTYFKFFYHELTSMGKNWMPFARDTVPWWLKQGASDPGDDFDEHFEIWTSFLISRDLMYGMAFTPTNYKCGVEYYNAAQFARQFGLCQLTPLPPYQSLNEDFTDRPVIQPRDLERVRNILPELRKSFALHTYVERTDKGAKFDSWWGGYVKMHFYVPYLDALEKLLPHSSGVPEPGINVPLQQISPAPSLGTKRKGAEKIPEDTHVDPTPQKPKRTKMLARKSAPKDPQTNVAGRTRSSAKTSSPESDPLEKAISKIKEGQADSAPTKKRLRKKKPTPTDSENTVSATEGNPIELDDYIEEEKETEDKGLDLPDLDPEHEASSRTPEKPSSPAIKPIPAINPPVEPEFVTVPEEEDEDLDSLFKSAQDLLKAANSGTSGSGLGSTSQSQFTPEEVAEAKTALRMALLQNFKAIVHPARASSVRKAMEVLVKAQALGVEETTLQYFQKEFPAMIKSHDSSNHELNKVNAKLAELDLVDMELTRFSSEWNQLKEDIKVNEASITTTSNEIQDLKTQLEQAEGRLENFRKESRILAQNHEELKAGSKSQKMKLNLLIEEVPGLRGQRDTLETQLASLDSSWTNLKNSLEGLL